MISVTFYREGSRFTGFELTGHSDYAEQGSDIVCAAASSAAYLTANNIIDVFGIEANVTLADGYMELTAASADNLDLLIDGLYRHTLQLEEQYKQDISLKITEV